MQTHTDTLSTDKMTKARQLAQVRGRMSSGVTRRTHCYKTFRHIENDTVQMVWKENEILTKHVRWKIIRRWNELKYWGRPAKKKKRKKNPPPIQFIEAENVYVRLVLRSPTFDWYICFVCSIYVFVWMCNVLLQLNCRHEKLLSLQGRDVRKWRSTQCNSTFTKIECHSGSNVMSQISFNSEQKRKRDKKKLV